MIHCSPVHKAACLLSGLVSLFLVSSIAQADTLSSWQFDRDRAQLTLTTDEEVQPRVRLVANPSRVVIDLPGIVLGDRLQRQLIGAGIQEVRVGQFNADTTRLVIALAPGYTLDPTQVQVTAASANQWSVQLPRLQRLSRAEILQAANQPDQAIAVPEAPPSAGLMPGNLFAGVVPVGHRLTDLEAQLQTVIDEYSFLRAGMFFMDLDTGDYVNIHGSRAFPAASTIKLPLLIAFFQDVDAGTIKLDEVLTMRASHVTDGSGEMQFSPVGSRYSALETATMMITISDNTATNMIIDRLGGIAAVNRRFHSWGLEDTVMRNWLSDLRGTNTTSPQDLTRVLAMVVNGDLLTTESRDRALGIMRNTVTRTLLPAGLGAGADIAHKTGDIGFLIGDAGVVTLPNGKRYLAGIFVRRPYDDVRGRYFIQNISRTVYNYLGQLDPVASSSDRPNCSQ
jgi:beta-lactamase class A